eukprot:gnl/Trimastix_PCT/495.p5 GENE.gnl/Trimastix_PCT/495~~gnl/Trimastix_PCT/495.p5  ORF type:complete len:106 (-),score=21.67 gnl/Trimastix_PCT/495:2234-2551(-)
MIRMYSSTDPLDQAQFQRLCHSFQTRFLRYLGANIITPYIHMLTVHGPSILKRYGCVGKLACGETERQNKVMKRKHQGMSFFGLGRKLPSDLLVRVLEEHDPNLQ